MVHSLHIYSIAVMDLIKDLMTFLWGMSVRTSVNLFWELVLLQDILDSKQKCISIAHGLLLL